MKETYTLTVNQQDQQTDGMGFTSTKTVQADSWDELQRMLCLAGVAPEKDGVEVENSPGDECPEVCQSCMDNGCDGCNDECRCVDGDCFCCGPAEVVDNEEEELEDRSSGWLERQVTSGAVNFDARGPEDMMDISFSTQGGKLGEDIENDEIFGDYGHKDQGRLKKTRYKDTYLGRPESMYKGDGYPRGDNPLHEEEPMIDECENCGELYDGESSCPNCGHMRDEMMHEGRLQESIAILLENNSDEFLSALSKIKANAVSSLNEMEITQLAAAFINMIRETNQSKVQKIQECLSDYIHGGLINEYAEFVSENMEDEDEEDDDSKLEYIAGLIVDGFTSGIQPTWSLTADRDVLDDDSALEEIARLVKEGFTSGYHPRWSIDID